MNKKDIYTILFLLFCLIMLLFGKKMLLAYYNHFAFIPKVKLTHTEKVFIDSLKKTCNCYDVYRNPGYVPEYYKNDNTYEVVLDIYRRNIKNRDSLNSVAFKIARYSYMKIHKKDTSIFTRYKVIFWGKDKISFNFNAKELNRK